MAKKRDKKYIPTKNLNPVVLRKKMNKLEQDLVAYSELLNTVISSYDKHVEHLANFANHDMKNSLQSLDSILYTNDHNTLTQESWDTLKTCLKNIRNSFDNFSNLVPHSNSNKFKIERLFIALNLLIKQEILDNNIQLDVTYPKENEIDLPFQSILQMLHNIIINALSSFKKHNIDCPILKIKCLILDDSLEIVISDNGKAIESKLKDEIFKYGFSTTGGSGIGLYHAKYVCRELNGSIILDLEEKDNINKSFIINLPFKK